MTKKSEKKMNKRIKEVCEKDKSHTKKISEDEE